MDKKGTVLYLEKNHLEGLCGITDVQTIVHFKDDESVMLDGDFTLPLNVSITLVLRDTGERNGQTPPVVLWELKEVIG